MGESTSTVCVHQTDCLCATEAGQENMAKGVNAEIELRDDSGKMIFGVYLLSANTISRKLFLSSVEVFARGLAVLQNPTNPEIRETCVPIVRSILKIDFSEF